MHDVAVGCTPHLTERLRLLNRRKKLPLVAHGLLEMRQRRDALCIQAVLASVVGTVDGYSLRPGRGKLCGSRSAPYISGRRSAIRSMACFPASRTTLSSFVHIDLGVPSFGFYDEDPRNVAGAKRSTRALFERTAKLNIANTQERTRSFWRKRQIL